MRLCGVLLEIKKGRNNGTSRNHKNQREKMAEQIMAFISFFSFFFTVDLKCV